MKTMRYATIYTKPLFSLLAGLCLFCSCEYAENRIPDPGNGTRSVQLFLSLENKNYTSDSEIIPMKTRNAGNYVVTPLINHVLFVLKQAGNEWVIVEKRENVIISPGNDGLREGETLTLNEEACRYILSPGTYRFLLFVNLIHQRGKNVVGDRIQADLLPGQAPPVMATQNPPADFFFGQDDIILTKTDKLNQQNDIRINLKLKRKSALVRFILEGEKWLDFGTPTVFCRVSGQQVNTGFDIIGRQMYGDLGDLNKMIDIKTDTYYQMGDKNWCFSSLRLTNNNLLLFADEVPRNIELTITAIGNSNTMDYWFTGNHPLIFSIRENHITTVLIRKEGLNDISTRLNPETDEWSDTYPPLDYIELNNP